MIRVIPLDTDLIDNIKKIIVETVKIGTTFVELEHALDNANIKHVGDYAYESETCKNVLFWINMNLEFCQAITELRYEGKISMSSTTILTYIIDGKCLSLPILKESPKKPKEYKKEHWVPVVFRKGDDDVKDFRLITKEKVYWQRNHGAKVLITT